MFPALYLLIRRLNHTTSISRSYKQLSHYIFFYDSISLQLYTYICAYFVELYLFNAVSNYISKTTIKENHITSKKANG